MLRLNRLVPSIALLTVFCVSAFGQANVITWHNDNARTGQNTQEGILSPNYVTSSKFGLLYSLSVDGKVDAQPLYLSALAIAGHPHNVAFVATEHDSVYAFDADSGAVYWHVSLLQSGEVPSDNRGCSQVTPEIGVTATPVISSTAGPHGTLFVVAMSKDSHSNYYQRLHALDLTTGAEQFNGPVTVQARFPGNGDNSMNGYVVFDAKQYKERPGLLIVNGTIYTAWSSHCDNRPYTGWLMGYDQSLHQTSVLNFAPNGSEAALWNAGSGPAADSQNNIYLAIANGSFDTTLNSQGFPGMGDYGNAVVKVAVQNGSLAATDYWTMYNTVQESNSDTDLGSGGAMLLPDLRDANNQIRHLGVAAGKDSNIYVFDRDNLGKFVQNSNSTLYQELAGALPGGMWSSPAYFNNHVYFGAQGDVLRSFGIAAAKLSSAPVSTTANSFAYPGTTPSISALASAGSIGQPGNAILWAVDNRSPAVLHAYNAGNLSTEYYNSNQAGNRDHFGAGNKFMVPTIANGKVFVGTTNSVAVFGLLHQLPPTIPETDYTVTGNSNLLLTNSGYSPTLHYQITEAAPNGNNTQRWFFAYQGNGYYSILNVQDGYFLADLNGSRTPGAPLVQQPSTSNDTQLWSLTASGGGYIITNKSSGLVIEDPDGGPGTGIILTTANGQPNQVFLIQ